MGILSLVGLPRQIWRYAKLERITWVDESVGASGYPRDESFLSELAAAGVSVLINLHQRAQPAGVLARHGLTEVHLPVPDFTAPTPSQLAEGVAAIHSSVSEGRKVVVHCGAGLGRTGTLVACYLVTRCFSATDALARIRALRPGSVETPEQEQAVREFALGLRSPGAADR